MGADKNIKSNRSKIYFASLIVLIIAAFVSMIWLNLKVRDEAVVREEARYHSIDKVYAANFIPSFNGGETNSNIVFTEDVESYVAIINSNGDAICLNSGRNSGTSTSNVFKYLNTGKLSHPSYEEAIALILSGKDGSFEFYSGNQNKILIYTAVIPQEYAVVRVIPMRYFADCKDEQTDSIKKAMLAQIVIYLVALIFIVHLMRHTYMIEEFYKRQTLIAADNELISFTYHASIASFEMTGAVESVFGEEIGKRGQIDWNTLSRLLHPDDQMMLRNISKAIKRGDTKYTTEFRLVDSEGEFHWYRLNGKCVQNDGNDNIKFVGTIQNSDDQISHENMLKNKAEHDLLTGLLNKITIQESVDVAILNASYSVYAFYIIDLDNFKAVNDNLGHAVGDKVLTDVAGKLQLVFNEADYIGRLGGDEFAVLLVIPSMMTSQAEKLIREKAKLLNEMLRATYGDEKCEINVSASIGIAIYPEDGGDFSTLYQHADRALYHSKENGKDQFTFYTEVE